MPILNQPQDVVLDSPILSDIQGHQFNTFNGVTAPRVGVPSDGGLSHRQHHINDILGYTDANLYTALLSTHGNGCPQWIPEPVFDSGYEEHGVKIGDVGIVDPGQPFDFLFNIRDTSGLPAGTSQLLTEPEVVSLPMWGRDHVIWSRTMERRDKDSTETSRLARIVADFHLESSCNAGALLVLPEGVSRQDLRTSRDFLDYALQHGVGWYQYARDVRC